jgi:hypothetical protein
MRKLLISVTAAAAVAALVPLVVLAAGAGRESGDLDRQAAAWRSAPASTSSTAWRTIPSLSFTSTASGSNTLCALNELSVMLSANLRGAPVRFRVLMDGGPVLQPGPARFIPGPEERTVTAMWVGHAGTFEGLDRHALEVQWRSPSGRPVTLTRGVVNVLFEAGASC